MINQDLKPVIMCTLDVRLKNKLKVTINEAN